MNDRISISVTVTITDRMQYGMLSAPHSTPVNSSLHTIQDWKEPSFLEKVFRFLVF